MRAEWLTSSQDRWGVPEWEFRIEANGFLRGMVRRIVGTLVQVGHGLLEPARACRDSSRKGPCEGGRAGAGMWAVLLESPIFRG